MDLHQRLRDFGLFRGLSPEDIAGIAGLLQVRYFNPGAYLCMQGDPANTLFLIESGAVEVLNRVSDEREAQLAIRQEGDSIGEMALIENEKRAASVRCLEPVRALILSRDDLHDLIDTHPKVFIQIMMNLLRQVSSRLKKTDQVYGSGLFDRD